MNSMSSKNRIGGVPGSGNGTAGSMNARFAGDVSSKIGEHLKLLVG